MTMPRYVRREFPGADAGGRPTGRASDSARG
jgi:hypothetical protein